MALVAYPLWRAGTLAGTQAGEIASSFLALPLLAAVVPWSYAWKTFVVGSMPARAQAQVA